MHIHKVSSCVVGRRKLTNWSTVTKRSSSHSSHQQVSRATKVQESYWWPKTSWSLSNFHCCCPTMVHKKPAAGTLWYSPLQLGNLSLITEKRISEITTLAGSVGLNVDIIEWAQGNGISSWVEQDHYYQQIFLSDWISLCSAKIFSNVKWYLFGYASVHLCTVNLFCLHCKKWFVILTIAFVTRIATVTWF